MIEVVVGLRKMGIRFRGFRDGMPAPELFSLEKEH